MTRIVIVGAGLAGHGVARELRRASPEAQLTLVTADDGHFYSKPALSTALAKEKTAETLVTSSAQKLAEQLKMVLRTRTRVNAIDRAAKRLETSAGPIEYDKLILALGADAVRLRLEGDAASDPVSINDLDQYAAFRAAFGDSRRAIILGAGLVGSEFANDLTATGREAIVVDPMSAPLAALIPPRAGQAVRDALSAQGVEWRLGRLAKRVDRDGKGYVVTLDDGERLVGDLVISAVGLRPHTALAKDAGLRIDKGVEVDWFGRTSDADIFALGDCAQYPIGLAAYVTPIMSAARAISANALGQSVQIKFPALSVQIKTTACPVALLPPLVNGGAWSIDADDAKGLRLLNMAADGALMGYVLTGAYCSERVELDRRALADAAAAPA